MLGKEREHLREPEDALSLNVAARWSQLNPSVLREEGALFLTHEQVEGKNSWTLSIGQAPVV